MNTKRSLCQSLNYLYAGLQNAGACFCGNFYGAYGKIDDLSCNQACFGDSNEKCGGFYKNSVYNVTEVIATIVTPTNTSGNIIIYYVFYFVLIIL